MAKRRQGTASEGAATGEKYPTVRKGISRILEEGTVPDVQIEFFECTFLANGEATYRWREPRAQETDGGFLPGG